MVEIIEVFDGAKNVEFEEFTFVEEIGAELPVFTLTEQPTAKWNQMARKQNTKMFIETHDTLPVNYDEVLSWVYSLIGEQNENNYKIKCV